MEERFKELLITLEYEEITPEYFIKHVRRDGEIIFIIRVMKFDEFANYIYCDFYKDGQILMEVALAEQCPKNAEMYLQYMWETLKLGYYVNKEEI